MTRGVEHLPSKCEAPKLNHSTAKKICTEERTTVGGEPGDTDNGGEGEVSSIIGLTEEMIS
jgi:hypothetical protein